MKKAAKTILRLPLEKRAELAFKRGCRRNHRRTCPSGVAASHSARRQTGEPFGARRAPRFRSDCGKIDQRFRLCDIRSSFTLSSSFLLSKIAKYRRTSRTIISGFPPPALQGIGHLIARAG